jgi:hypothetical protein
MGTGMSHSGRRAFHATTGGAPLSPPCTDRSGDGAFPVVRIRTTAGRLHADGAEHREVSQVRGAWRGQTTTSSSARPVGHRGGRRAGLAGKTRRLELLDVRSRRPAEAGGPEHRNPEFTVRSAGSGRNPTYARPKTTRPALGSECSDLASLDQRRKVFGQQFARKHVSRSGSNL